MRSPSPLFQALLWLLYVPNLDSRLNGAVSHKMSEFEVNVRKAICGEKVGGNTYDNCLTEKAPVEVLLRVLYSKVCHPVTWRARAVHAE